MEQKKIKPGLVTTLNGVLHNQHIQLSRRTHIMVYCDSNKLDRNFGFEVRKDTTQGIRHTCLNVNPLRMTRSPQP